ncbi:DUF1206 domain-containing protein [Clostridium frigoris]|uniref:DUF1206 domain-containing protein n=1 Tax=Clostridium frigoris TaxID=205327 RepID=A0ABS6BX87_9CLOT|nr:DUF1206 domain-containing protein [Clostridium frigoris]MBU3161223.1 DUF1206 domain-containing protein [Clostridium frigoris]
MANKEKAIRKMKKTSEDVAHNDTFNSTAEFMARVGFATRGLIFSVMGILALLIAFGSGGKTTDQQGAIAMIGKQPEGKVLLWIVLIGLICYSSWGLIQVVINPFNKENDTKGISARLGYLFGSISYSFLAIPTYALLTGGSKPVHVGKQAAQTQNYVAKILDLPFGQWLVVVVAITVIIVGAFQVCKGFMPHFGCHLDLIKLNTYQLKWVKGFGIFGTISRGFVIILVGVFLVIAAYTSDSNEAKGFDSALMSLMHQSYGRWLIGIVALGLMSLGIYALLIALFFRLKEY